MGQWGAQGYALHGFSYEDILAADYPGTVLSQTTVRKIRVLLADGTEASDRLLRQADRRRRRGRREAHVPAGGTKLTTALPYPAPLTLSAAHGATLTLGTAYRGKLVISLVNGKLRAINVVGLQQYLDGNVPVEMPSSWLPDALDAQAVASRSYALAGRQAGAAYDVSVSSQSYLGVAAETPQGTRLWTRRRVRCSRTAARSRRRSTPRRAAAGRSRPPTPGAAERRTSSPSKIRTTPSRRGTTGGRFPSPERTSPRRSGSRAGRSTRP